MRINEVIAESAELDEGWKSKLAGAALAGAAALGGGHTAHAQNHQPTAQTQQASPSAGLEQYIRNGEPTSKLNPLAMTLGSLSSYEKAGKLTSDQSRLYNKYMKILLQARTQIKYTAGLDNSFTNNANFTKSLNMSNLPTYIKQLEAEEQRKR